jgi:hypothetical protein
VTATLEAADEPAGTYPVGEMLVGPNTFLPSGKLPDLRIGDMARDGRKLTDAEQNEELRKRWAEAAKKDPPPVDGEPSLKELQLWHMYWEHRYDTLRSEAEKMRIAREKVPGSVSDSQVLTVAGDIFKARAEALRYERELKLRALKDGEPGASATGGEAGTYFTPVADALGSPRWPGFVEVAVAIVYDGVSLKRRLRRSSA